MQSHTQPGEDLHLLATSPITSSFVIVDTLLETDHSHRDSLTNASPVSSTGGGTVGRELFSLHFLCIIHVLYVLHKVLIKLNFLIFLNCSKTGPKSLYYSTWSRAKIWQK